MASLPNRKAKSVPYAPRTYAKWTDEDVACVLEMRREGASLVEIAAAIKRTPGAVSAMLQRRSIAWMNEEGEA